MKGTIEISNECVVYGLGKPYVLDTTTGEELPEERQKEIFDAIRKQNEEDEKTGKWKCPVCKSDNVWIGAFVLSCEDCGYDYRNKYPCTVCGKPSFSLCGVNGRSYYGCKEHPATSEVFTKMLADANTKPI